MTSEAQCRSVGTMHMETKDERYEKPMLKRVVWGGILGGCVAALGLLARSLFLHFYGEDDGPWVFIAGVILILLLVIFGMYIHSRLKVKYK
ncbi:MAG: hypothetical protein EBT45_08260 [Alphaproteobacteria bacterium]|nr:hypothetical protein [Alphaproteobacteria bacterium]